MRRVALPMSFENSEIPACWYLCGDTSFGEERQAQHQGSLPLAVLCPNSETFYLGAVQPVFERWR